MWHGENTYKGALKWDAGKLFLSFELPGYVSSDLSLKSYAETEKWGSQDPIVGEAG
jgi:hypothetical protein